MRKRIINFAVLLFVCLMILLSDAPTGKMKDFEIQTQKLPMFVLQVGISNYTKSPKLPGAVTDILEMNKLLKERFNATIAEPLLDANATKAKIFEAFEKELIQKAQEYHKKSKGRRDAVVLFQFSGHGSQVKDVAPNKDETDDLDETLVTVNSEDKPGKNFDITDDELYVLTRRLGEFTDNIVFILDSCHSGSGTRGDGVSRNISRRETQPVVVPFANPKTRGTTRNKTENEKDNLQTDVLPLSDEYIVISAARADQRAGEIQIYDKKTKTLTASYGRMTYYLLKNLREVRKTDKGEIPMTYADLMRAVRREVISESNNKQIPQIEGASKRVVFGGLSKIEDNTIKISVVAVEEPQEDGTKKKVKKIVLEAGAAQGITNGTIVELRSKLGEKIGTAKVSDSAADRSFLNISDGKIENKEITDEDRAVIITQDFSAFRLRVMLDGDGAAKLSEKDKSVISSLNKGFAPNKEGMEEAHGIDLVNGKLDDRNWDIALVKDKFKNVFPEPIYASRTIKYEKDGNGNYKLDNDNNKIAVEDEKRRVTYEDLPSGDTEVFYLADKDLTPVYGFYVEAGKSDTAATIESALLQLVRLRSVKAIANEKSVHFGKVEIKPIRLIPPFGCNSDGTLTFKEKQAFALNDSQTAYKVEIGELFWLEITNTSGQDLYITLLDISTDGSVQIMLPRPFEDKTKLEAAANNKITYFDTKCVAAASQTIQYVPVLVYTTPPAGLETFKVIATTEPVRRESYEFLEMKSILNSRGGISSMSSVKDWTTAEISFELTAPKN